MTILTIPKKVFEREIGKFDEKMKDRIIMFGTEIENVNEEEINLEITPDRPDLLSYSNYKNSFLSYLGKKAGLRKININKPEKNYEVAVDSSMSKIRPYTVCAIVCGLRFDDDKIKEVIEIQEKLHLTIGRKRKKLAIGVYPLEQIKLPIKFTCLKPDKIKFQPLEFPREITGKQILSQHPAGREYGFLLEGLEKYPVFVDANNEILSMPPIINSHKTGKITFNTRDVFIEVSGFDLEIQKKALNILTSALSEIGGKIYQMKVKYSDKTITTPDFTPEKIKLSIENTNKLLGLELKENEVKKLLEKMGYDYSNKIASVPTYRTDILHEVDLIEDIAIAYGYDNFAPEIPQISTIGETDKKEILKSKISEILSGLNLLETSSYHLINKETIKKLGSQTAEFVKVQNSKTEYEYLRKELSNCMFKILSENVDVEYPQEIFQIGRVFLGDLSEEEKLAVALTPGNFTKIKQVVEYLGKMLNISFDVSVPVKSPDYFIDGRVAEVKLESKTIGYFGEVHPKILKNFHLKLPVAFCEIYLKSLFEKLI